MTELEFSASPAERDLVNLVRSGSSCEPVAERDGILVALGLSAA